MKQALLIYGATSLGSPLFSSDLFWCTGRFSVPDPVHYFEIDGKKILMLSSLEIERARSEAAVDEIVSLETFGKEGKPAVAFLKERGIEEVLVPKTLPFSLGRELSEHFTVTIAEEPLFPERAIKTEEEMKEIEAAQRAVEQAVGKARDFLRACSVRETLLYHETSPEPVASRRLRKIIDDALYEEGYLGVETIVSCGRDAADPHCKGYGNLKAWEPIVLDVFPRSLTTLYFADQTRTFFKGEPSEKLQKMYQAVLAAQELGIARLRDGAKGSDIEKAVRTYFETQGYPTDTGTPVKGFIHSLGHGVGIDIHEEPRLSARHEAILQAGNVVTVEPGLYYQEEGKAYPAGGIRIEDMLLVTTGGSRNLTQFPKSLDHAIIE